MQPPSLLAAFTLTKKHQSEHQRMVQDDCSAVLFLLRPVGKAEMSGAGVLRAFANSSFASRITGCHTTDTNSIISVNRALTNKRNTAALALIADQTSHALGAVQQYVTARSLPTEYSSTAQPVGRSSLSAEYPIDRPEERLAFDPDLGFSSGEGFGAVAACSGV
jgi:hypothetical protein